MDAVSLFQAVSYLEDRDILIAWEAAPRRGTERRMLTRVLLAALIAALLLSACAAVYLLTLEKRLTPSSIPEQAAPISAIRKGTLAEEGGYLSHHRAGNSPAAMATAAWADAWRECTKGSLSFDDSWYQGNAELEAACLLYSAYTPEMAEKLFAIRDQYGIRLHTACWGLNGPESLYQAAGTGDFFLSDEHGMMVPHKIYEDGSFVCEGTLDLPASEQDWCLFRIERNRADVLINGSLFIPDPAAYSEWEYTTPDGECLSMALSTQEGKSMETRAFAFFDTADWAVVLRLDFPSAAGRETAEELINSFDFQAICTGGDHVQEYFEKGPTVSTGQALTPADFAAAPEAQAADAFRKKYEEYLRETIGKEERWKNTGFRGSAYYGGFPSGDEGLDALAEELWQQYGLLPASEGLYQARGAFFPPEAVYPWGALKGECQSVGESTGRQKLREWLGSGVTDNWSTYGTIYSNGCFEDGRIHYLKKGCFYTALAVALPSNDLPYWVYDTAWGGTVTIVVDESVDCYGQPGLAYILYETESAYVLSVAYSHEPLFLEEIADSLDMSRLP